MTLQAAKYWDGSNSRSRVLLSSPASMRTQLSRSAVLLESSRAVTASDPANYSCHFRPTILVLMGA
jgi:hypothetical protein